MLQGVDTSTFQGRVDERQMKDAGIDFRYIKLAEGGDFIDPTWGSADDPTVVKLSRLRDSIARIRNNGMKVGGYHYLRVKAGRTGGEEITFAIDTAKRLGLDKPGDMRLAIDIEDRGDLAKVGPAVAGDYLIHAILRYRRQLGYYPVLYSDPGYWAEITRGASAAKLRVLKSCPLWIAHFDVQAPSIPKPWTESAIWQKTAKAAVGGERPADFNVSDPSRFASATIPGPKPPPVPSKRPVKDHDVRDLQDTLNRFTSKWLEGVNPLIADGVMGHATRSRVLMVKWYLGYGKKRTAEVDSDFIRRVRHPRDVRYALPSQIIVGVGRRRKQKKNALKSKAIAGFPGAVLYDGQAVAEWTVKWLNAARNYGGAGGPWRGQVVSGIRTPAHSIELCRAMCNQPSCPGRCAGASSNHNATPPVTNCEGALDVSDYLRFGQIMRAIGAPLKNDLPIDLVHFSCTGH